MNTKERQFDALARIAGLRPEADFRHMVLREVDFLGSNLDGFDFTGCRFKRCSFVGARIGTALLHGSDFEETDPSEALDWEERWHRAVTGLTPVKGSQDKHLNPSENGIEDALFQLEEYWSDPDWPLLFQRNWHHFRPDERLLGLSRRWLDSCKPAAATPLLLTLVDDPAVPDKYRDWLVKFSDAVLQRYSVDLPGWTRLWIRLLELPSDPAERLQIGTQILCQLTLELPERRLSRRGERAWVTLWARLNQHQNGDRALLEDQARRAASILGSSDFASRVLQPIARNRAWARDALRHWLLRAPVGRRGWAQTLARYLEWRSDSDVCGVAFDWLAHTDPTASSWPVVWTALASKDRGEQALKLGVKWLETVPVVAPRWPDVLAKLLTLAPNGDVSALKKRAAEWLRLERPHIQRALIRAFASGQAVHEPIAIPSRSMTELRGLLREAAERHLGEDLREVAKNRFVGDDGDLRAAIRLSKRYPHSSGARYWYSYYDSVDEFLTGSGSYLILGCVDRDEGYAVPADVLREMLSGLHETIGRSPYWHIHLIQQGKQLVMVVPKARTVLDLSAFRFPLKRRGRRPYHAEASS
jgi:hypothetical protein